MQANKKIELDPYDREILKVLIAHRDTWLTLNELRKITKFSWITIKRHIIKLKRLNMLEIEEYGKKRYYRKKTN